MADRTGFFVVDYDDRTTCATRYLARCTHEKTTELRGYECREHAEAAARKWISDRLGQSEVPKAVAPADSSLSVVEMVVRGALATIEALRLSVEHLDCEYYPADRDLNLMRAVDVRHYRMQLLQRIEDSYRAELDAIRLKRDPDYYTKAKHGD